MYEFADEPGGIKIAKAEKEIWSEMVCIWLIRFRRNY